MQSGYWQITLGMLIWGSVSIFTRLAEQPATIIVFFRVFTAFSLLSVYLCFRRQPIQLFSYGWTAALSGLFLACSWFFIFKAIQTTTIGNAVMIYCIAPVFSILWARFFLQEKLEKRSLAALGLAALGVIFMVVNYQFSLSPNDCLGIFLSILSALCYSFLSIMAKKMPNLSPALLLWVQTGTASLFFLPFIFFTPFILSVPSLGAMLMLGSVHTVAVLILYYSGLKTVKIQHASILSYLDPGSAILYAYLIFGEIPSVTSAVGGLCILIASILACTGKSTPKKQSHSQISASSSL